MSEIFLVGIDSSECSHRALGFARKRAQAAGGKLVLVYVIEWSPYTFNTVEENDQRHKRREEEINQAHKSVLDPALGELKTSGIEAEGIVRHGHVAAVLTQLAEDTKADTIIIGRIGQSGLKSLLFGSVTSKLIQLAEVPVTVVP